MARISNIVLVAAAMALPASAMAQGLGPAGRPFENERRISVGLAIPLGGPAAARTSPRLELRGSAVDQGNERSHGMPGDTVQRLFPNASRDARIGFTLEARPRLTVAGRELPESENKLGVSTFGWVAIGVAAAAIIGGLLFVDAVRDSSD